MPSRTSKYIFDFTGGKADRFIFGDTVTSYFNLYHIPLVSYPDSKDWAGLLYEASVNNYDFGDLVQAQISGGLNGNNVRHIINRLDRDQWPGWPTVYWKVINPAYDKTIPEDPDQPWRNPIEIDVEIPEKLSRAFPGVPFREAGIDLDEPTFPHDKADVRTYAANYGVDSSFTLNGIWSGMEEEQRQYVDNIHFSPVVRLWDVADPAKHYLYEFYKLQLDAGMSGLVTEKPGEDGSGSNGDGFIDEDPKFDDPIEFAKYQKKLTTALEADENRAFLRTGVTVIAEGWEAYAGYSFLEAGQERDTGSEAYRRMLGYNRKKTTPEGNYKEDFYVSTADFMLSCGYIAWTQAQLLTYLRTPNNATRAKPLVEDNSPNRDLLRVDTPVTVPSYVSIINEEGIAARGGELIPGKLYYRLSSTSLQQITPGIAGSATPNEDFEIEAITYFHVHKEGYDWITVWFPRTGLFINDAETNVADKIITFDVNNVQAAAVPFFPDIVLEFDFYPKSDLFAVSWHITIAVSNVQVSSFNWFKLLLIAAVFVLLLWFPPAGVQAFSAAAFAHASTVLISGLVITRLAYAIFADDPVLAALVMVTIAVATGQYDQLLNIAQATVTQLPQILVQFLSLLERTQKMMLHMAAKEYEDEIADMQQQLEEYQQEMNEYAPAVGGTLDLPSLLFQEEEEEDDDLFHPYMVSADTFYKATDNYHNLGYDMLDADKFYDMALDTRVER